MIPTVNKTTYLTDIIGREVWITSMEIKVKSAQSREIPTDKSTEQVRHKKGGIRNKA